MAAEKRGDVDAEHSEGGHKKDGEKPMSVAKKAYKDALQLVKDIYAAAAANTTVTYTTSNVIATPTLSVKDKVLLSVKDKV